VQVQVYETPQEEQQQQWEEEQVVECCEQVESYSVSEVSVVQQQQTTTMTSTTTTTTEEFVTFEELAADATGEEANEELITDELKSDEVSVVSSAFAEQLANVQTQLMALSHLPKTIQSTLDEITKQLQSLIPPSKLVKQNTAEPENKSEETTVTSEGEYFRL